MDRISLSTVDLQSQGDEYAIDMAAKLDLDGIDLDLSMHDVAKCNDVYSKGEEAVIEYFTSLSKYAKEKGVTIAQTHGRLYGYGVDSEGDERFLKNARYETIATSILGAKYCVVHTPAYNWVGDLCDEDMYRIGVSLFSSILPFAKERGVKLAAETHGTASKYGKMEFYGIVDHFLGLFDRIREVCDSADALCICVDTGHTNLGVAHGHQKVGDVIRRLGSLVEVLHLHDNDGVKDQHKMPKTGNLDWGDIVSALREIDYRGYFNLESSIDHFGRELMMDEAALAIKILRALLDGKIK